MYNEVKANEVIDFIQLLKHTGDFKGQQFIVAGWEREVIENVYGTVKENGCRQYRFGYLEIPKKNGKTEFIGALGVKHLECDPPGGEIYCCAADREQASKIYMAAKTMIEQEPDLNAADDGNLKIVDSQKLIINLDTGTFLKVISAEAFTKHGMNPSVILFDELHAQPGRDLWDTMTFGTDAARREQLVWIITTAGDDPDKKSIGWEIHDQACKIRDGELTDPLWYVKIYGITNDKSIDIYDEALWYSVNPSLGISIDIEKIRQEAVAAKNNPANEKLFRWLRLNQWVQLKKIGWLPVTLWDDTDADWDISELAGKRCYVGIDLASKIDLTAIVCLFPPQVGIDNWRFTIDAWVPLENMKERVQRDHVAYEEWVNNNYLHTTPGDVVDYSALKNHLVGIEKTYNATNYCGDPWNLDVLKQMLPSEIALKFSLISQSMGGMTPGMKELERLFRAKLISHTKNPLGRWCFGNVIIATDGNENIKPMKNKSMDRIDPIVALINAMSGAIKLEPKRSVYEERGMRSLI